MEADNQKEKSKIALAEEEVLALWEKESILAKVLKARAKGKRFVFYEGPPTANGMPHPGHVLGRTFKDLFVRYKSMQGYFVPRRAGWDTHGLPVEIEIEKKLGFRSKADIEKYGVAEFNKLCKESVWKYKGEWEKMTRRVGLWLDMEHPYITYENNYIETLWWVIKRVFEKGLLEEDYKVMPFCVRCGTGLSSHELGQPGAYRTVTEESVYVKFPVREKKKQDEELERKAKEGVVFDDTKEKAKEYFLVWTTTPWTLPANVALAVNPDLIYVKAKKENEILILAKDRMSVLGEGWEIIQELKGKELAGAEYRQVFDFVKVPHDAKAFYVAEGDFVLATDGSGIVHIAPAYGEDDMRMAKQYGLPILHPVMENGEFVPQVKWTGKFVKNTDSQIRGELQEQGLLFKTEQYEHEYPFCWRCDTPILYFARKSWFIKMSELKSKVLENNQKINWVPAHIKEGRFGEWIGDLKDWAFSRNRYWGTPLPVWRCHSCQHTEVIESIAELADRSKLHNRYFVMRHGEALHNTKNLCDSSQNPKNKLTKKGKEQAMESLTRFKKTHPDPRLDIVVASPFVRTQETARIVAEELNIPQSAIITETTIAEINVGIFDGKKTEKYHGYYSSPMEKFVKAPPEGESLHDTKKRLAAFMRQMESRYENKTVLVVSHEYPIWILESMLAGLDDEKTMAAKKKRRGDYIKTGEIKELGSAKLPLDNDGNIDVHKPYIDDISFVCEKCSGVMKRVPEVADVWFDSGAMPLAQEHFPFAFAGKGKRDTDKLLKKIDFPADFICEGVDQTRGWFYTLLAVSTLLDMGEPYRNVVSLGHILDKSGKKMSKSKKNYTDPMLLADTYGIDAVRWYFYIVNPAGEPKRFDEKDVLDTQRKSVMMLLNISNFLGAYHTKKKGKGIAKKTALDRWIVSRLEETTRDATAFLDAYDAQGSSRAIAAFLDDLSNWYIRRSRERFQRPENKTDHEAAVQTLSFVFDETLKLCAPFMPFMTEHIWRQTHKDSIHLEKYPVASEKRIDNELTYAMIKVREIASIALQKRAEAGIKVRQILHTLKIQDDSLEPALRELIREEINVKEVVSDKTLTETVWLDVNITPALREEGMVREIVRHIQQARKDAGFTKKNVVSIAYDVSPELEKMMESNKEYIAERTIAKSIERVSEESLRESKKISLEEGEVRFSIK